MVRQATDRLAHVQAQDCMMIGPRAVCAHRLSGRPRFTQLTNREACCDPRTGKHQAGQRRRRRLSATAGRDANDRRAGADGGCSGRKGTGDPVHCEVRVEYDGALPPTNEPSQSQSVGRDLAEKRSPPGLCAERDVERLRERVLGLLQRRRNCKSNGSSNRHRNVQLWATHPLLPTATHCSASQPPTCSGEKNLSSSRADNPSSRLPFADLHHSAGQPTTTVPPPPPPPPLHWRIVVGGGLKAGRSHRWASWKMNQRQRISRPNVVSWTSSPFLTADTATHQVDTAMRARGTAVGKSSK